MKKLVTVWIMVRVVGVRVGWLKAEKGRPTYLDAALSDCGPVSFITLRPSLAISNITTGWFASNPASRQHLEAEITSSRFVILAAIWASNEVMKPQFCTNLCTNQLSSPVCLAQRWAAACLWRTQCLTGRMGFSLMHRNLIAIKGVQVLRVSPPASLTLSFVSLTLWVSLLLSPFICLSLS